MSDLRLQTPRGPSRLCRAPRAQDRSALSRDRVARAVPGGREHSAQGCFRTWPSCNSLRSVGIYGSIRENKSCTPCRQKERQTSEGLRTCPRSISAAAPGLPCPATGSRGWGACAVCPGRKGRCLGQRQILELGADTGPSGPHGWAGVCVVILQLLVEGHPGAPATCPAIFIYF